MFEWLFAKKVDKEQLTEVIEKASDKYYVDVTFKSNEKYRSIYWH